MWKPSSLEIAATASAAAAGIAAALVATAMLIQGRSPEAPGRIRLAAAEIVLARLPAPDMATATDPQVCLAHNIYWEARSEPLAGRVAVATVTLNRVRDPLFPADLCDVVRQGGARVRHGCQFSWWCDGKADVPRDPTAWRQAMAVAKTALAGRHDDPTGGALWYHADYVAPPWSRTLRPMARIGRHIFYGPPTPTEVADNR